MVGIWVIAMPEPQIDATLLMEMAKQKYPYLRDKNIGITYTPSPSDARQLEYWPANEPGDDEYKRPQALPMGTPGMEIFNKNVRPIDILGDYVSHEAINTDPQLKTLYGQFVNAIPAGTMEKRYQWHKEHGEKRPFEQWKDSAGLPEYFRGYTFDQWDNASHMYTPEELKILDEIRKYLGISGG